jgi:hypothetical protein
MIALTSSTSKANFLEQLSLQSQQLGPLYIEVVSLPAYLNTQISLTIFSYQLSNYPRSLIWTSKDTHILQLLRDSQLHISDNYFKPHYPSEEVAQVSPVTAQIVAEEVATQNIENKEAEPEKQPQPVNKSNTTSGISIDTSQLAKTGFFNKNTLQIIPNLDLPNASVSEQSTKASEYEEIKAPEFTSTLPTESNNSNDKKNQQAKINLEKKIYSTNMDRELAIAPHHENSNKISLAGLLSVDNYHPSSVISASTDELSSENELDVDLDFEDESILESGNLDSWLDRIQATKEALNELRQDAGVVNQNFFNQQKVNQPKSKWFYTIAASAMASFFIVSFLVFFPTTAYTLEVYPDYQDGTFVLEASKPDFSTKSFLLESKQSIPTQNKEKTETERSSGTIQLINEGGKDVLLDNAKFQIVKDGYRFSPVLNSSLPNTFSIPAQNNKGGDPIKFTIQSIPQPGVAGSSFNQPAGTRLKIVNLQDQSPCSSCYAVAVTDISNNNGEGDRVVSNADYDSLKNLTEQEVQKQRAAKIQDIRAEKIFTTNSWYKDLETTLNYNLKIGEKADNVELKKTVNSEIYYFSRSDIEEKIKQKKPEVYKIKELALLSSEGDIEKQSGIKATFYYTFSKNIKVETSNVSNLLLDKDFEEAKGEISKEYPVVKRIDKQELGFKLPGVSPRQDIKIVEKDSK